MVDNMIIVLEVLVLNVLVAGSVRGPHHPRGEAIVKHHVHYRPTKDSDQKLTQDAELLHDTAHIQEHLEEVIDEPDLTKMSDEELEFYYFQVHDTDKNAKLDGLEILQAILHANHNRDSEEEDPQQRELDHAHYTELIDRVLEEDDTDNDGYLSYAEYRIGKRKNTKQTEPVVKMLP